MVTTTILTTNAEGGRGRVITTIPALPHGDAGGFRFFAPRVRVATDGQRIYAGSSDRWEIGIWSPSGERLGTLTRPWTPRPVTDADKAWVRDAINRPDLAPGFTDDDRFDAMVPAFGTILTGPDGTVWVFDYAAPYWSADSVSVFDSAGGLIGIVGVPEGLRPTDVGTGSVLGTRMNVDGDFEVRRHGVRRPGSPEAR